MKLMTRNLLTVGALLFASFAVRAEVFPNRPVTIVVPTAAGALLDTLTRAVGQELAAKWGQPVVVENRPGASGLVGIGSVVRAKPDGYTLVMVSEQTYLGNRYSYRLLTYDPDKSLSNISILTKGVQLVVAHSSFPPSNLKELVEYAKDPKKLVNYGSYGDGSSPQLVLETMNKVYNTKIEGVAYKGAAPLLQALVANEVQVSVLSSATVGEMVKAGRLKVLGVIGDSRAPDHPNLPTAAEQGFPALTSFIWFGIAAPAGLPPAILAQISAAVREATQTPAVADKVLRARGWSVVASTPDEMNKTIKQQLPQVQQSFRAAGIGAK